MNSDEKQQTTARNILGAVIVLLTVLPVGAGVIWIGEWAILDHITGEITISGILRIIAILVGLYVLTSALAVLLTRSLTNIVGYAEIGGLSESKFISLVGYLGIAIGSGISIYVGATDATIGILPTETGESLKALACAVIPVAASYHVMSGGEQSNSTTGLEPEVVQRKTVQQAQQANKSQTSNNPPDNTPRSHPTRQTDANSNTGPNQRNTRPDQSPQRHDQQQGLDPDNMEFNWNAETGVAFIDIGGMDELKTELTNKVIKPLQEQERAEKLGINAPNIIFHGPPGTGKTYTAKALATELELPFAMLSGADLQSKWINESASQVNKLFTEAQRVAEQEGGAVVFLDELDTVLKDRSGGGMGHEEDNKVVNEFLNHLEDTKEHNIVFIGATNRLDALDDAGTRSGRIDKKIHVGKPDTKAREAILEQHLSGKENDITGKDISNIASATEGMVAADLEQVVQKAATRVFAREDGEDAIKFEDIQAALQENAQEQ
jgi:AAA+ superfamily predicted ATPase